MAVDVFSKPSGFYTPTTADQDALRVCEKFDECDFSFKRAKEKQWKINVAMLAGYQWMRLDQNGNLYFRPQINQGRFKAYSQSNFIRGYHDRRVASFSGFEPRFRGVPRTDEIEDRQGSEVFEQMLQHYWAHLHMGFKWYGTQDWVCATGNAFWWTQWDPEAGEVYVEDSVDEDGHPSGELFFDGDLSVEVVSPFELDFNPNAVNDEDVTVVRRRNRRSTDWIHQHYPERGKFVSDGQGREDESDDAEELKGLVGPSGFSGESTSSEEDDWPLVETLIFAQSRTYPRGRMIVRSASTILHNDDNPDPDHKIPIVHFKDMRVPGNFYAQSPIDNMISGQKDYNRIRSRQVENIAIHGNVKILNPSGSMMSESKFTSDVGEVWDYSGPQAPQYLPPPQMPTSLDDQLLTIRRDLDEAASQFGPERGMFQGKSSGKNTLALIEQGLKSREPVMLHHVLCLERWGQQAGRILQAHLDEKRAIKIVGKRRQFSIQFFSGADIRGNTDVSVDIESVRPKSREQALDTIQRLGPWLNPASPDDRLRVFQSLGWEDDTPLIASRSVHIRKAEIETTLMSKGVQVPEPNFTEDQDIHVAIHTEYIQTDEFMTLPGPIQQLHMYHLSGHMKLVAPNAGVTITPQHLALGAEPPEGDGQAPQGEQ